MYFKILKKKKNNLRNETCVLLNVMYSPRNIFLILRNCTNISVWHL